MSMNDWNYGMKGSNIIQILTKKDLLEMLPFGKTKLNELLIQGVLPVVKVGKDYITSDVQMLEWLKENEGKTIEYWFYRCYY